MDKILDYQLVKPMGSGASATVWHAVHRKMKPCALKVFSGDANSPDTRRIFDNEVKTAMAFSHGSVVQVFDAGEEQGRLWMACEWVDGVSLHAFNQVLWQRGGAWPIDLAAHVIGRLLVALSYVHEFSRAKQPMHVIHRDVKPGNVLVSAGGEIKLTDFGVSRMWHYDSHSTFRGTYRYVSLEHLQGRATQKSDLFGAGAVLYELLTNKPFRSELESPAELCEAILVEETVPALPIAIPTPLRLLVRALLAPSGERISTARAAHALLARWPGYRPCEMSLGQFFKDVMGRGARSGVTMHDGSDAPPVQPLPSRFQTGETYDLPVFPPEPDAPDVFRRSRDTTVMRPPFDPIIDQPMSLHDSSIPTVPRSGLPDEDDSGPVQIVPFFAKHESR